MEDYDACDQPGTYEQGDDQTQEDSLFEVVKRLEDDVTMLRAQVASLVLIATQYSESRDRWFIHAKHLKDELELYRMDIRS